MNMNRRGTMNFGLKENREKNRPPIPWGKIFGITLGLVAAAIIFIVWKPMWHWLFFAFLYKYWFVLLIWVFAIGLLAFLSYKTSEGEISTGIAWLCWISLICFIIFWFVFSFALAN